VLLIKQSVAHLLERTLGFECHTSSLEWESCEVSSELSVFCITLMHKFARAGFEQGVN
jgi:hypothetical protein